METYTITEAARACGISRKVLAHRVDRGTVRTVMQEGVHLIPRSELDRTELWPTPAGEPQTNGGPPPGTALVAIHQENERLSTEIVQTQRDLVQTRREFAQAQTEQRRRMLAGGACAVLVVLLSRARDRKTVRLLTERIMTNA